LQEIQLADLQVNDPDKVIVRDQIIQRDRKQAGLAARLALNVSHKEKCPVSLDTGHFR
jgi:hypothetical protein